ncbi:MAG TPA: FAD-dependent oxidoreductase [Thermoanaerobaculia bacterium]|nr:FAD-dependent oxidoreductase [Thermoanaerobaculia bacterium]
MSVRGANGGPAPGKVVAVVGGGISGIAASYSLRRRGIASEILEQSDVLGGRIGSARLGERLVDLGGKNIGRRYHRFRQFVAACGDNPYEYFGINSSQVRDGRMVTFDSRRRWASLLDLARRCRRRDLLRFGRMCLAVKRDEENGYLGSSYFDALAERLDDPPAGSYFGDELCRRLVRPMSVRMNGAEPDEIYLGNFGSNLRMVLDSYDQLTLGMQRVLEQFAQTATIRLGTRVESLVMGAGRVAGLRVTSPTGVAEERCYDGVVLATPAATSARIAASAARRLAELLGRVAYFPVALILAEYARDIFTSQVRALVFDEEEPLSNAGSYGIHDLNVVRYTFSGRTARSYLCGEVDMESLLRLGEERLNRHVPVDARERLCFVGRHYELGLCAYTRHYGRFAGELQTELRALPGLYLSGDYLCGASIEACFRASERCAAAVAADLAGPPHYGQCA